MIAGIVSGLGAASVLSISYLCSQLFYRQTRQGAMQLFAYSHVIMGGIALLMLPFVWEGFEYMSAGFLLFAAGSSLFLILGQISLFFSLQQARPSQVIPLLSLKIVMLALVSRFLLHDSVSLMQWGSVLLAVGATFVLNFSGESIPLRGFAGIISTCINYAFSDLCITLQLQELEKLGLDNPVFLGTSVSYIIAGSAGGIALFFIRKERASWGTWKYSGYFALAWFVAMIFLFNTYRLVGPVFGAVLQSTRAIISILLAKLLIMRGVSGLEQDMNAGVLLRRLLAAVFFTCAIALYVLG